MDTILSEFVAHTSADPGLATDLLEAHEWNLHSALSAYYVMKGILPGGVPRSDAEIASSHSKSSSSSTDGKASNGVSNGIARPPLKKLPAFEIDENEILNFPEKKLTRGISRATDNFTLVSKARQELAEDFDSSDPTLRPSCLKLELPEHSFSLPDFSVFPENLREYLQRDLIETATLVSLEQAGRLNWWYTRKIGKKLWPLSTTGDGNCLLHAASLGMWGFHDRLLTLRKALHSLLMNSSYTDAFYRRWRWQTSLQNKEAGLIYCEEEWEREWQSLLKLSSSEPRQSSVQRNSSEGLYSSSSDSQSEVYESLEELHVLALAHVLKRAIIVIADTVLKDVTGEPFAPIPFGGIYLPLECPPAQCHRSPLCLTFDSAHFSALVPMDNESEEGFAEAKAAIPVTDPDNKLLPLQFAIDPGPEVRWGQDENDQWIIARLTLTDKEKLLLLNEYLDIKSIEVSCENGVTQNKEVTQFKEMNGHLSEAKFYDPYESDGSSPDRGISCTGGKSKKSKAAKQFQTVAKQFGSLGRTMSKKIKNITRRGGSFKGETTSVKRASESALKNKRTLSGLPMMASTGTGDGSLNPRQVVVAVLDTEKKHEYQKKLIENYLHSAIDRFESNLKVPSKNGSRPKCINPGCSGYSTPSTSYLCSGCYAKQRHSELGLLEEGPVVISGKSSFYTEVGEMANSALEKLPVNGRLFREVLELKNSKFYDKIQCDTSTYHSTHPDYRCPSSSRDSHPVLKTIKESSTM